MVKKSELIAQIVELAAFAVGVVPGADRVRVAARDVRVEISDLNLVLDWKYCQLID